MFVDSDTLNAGHPCVTTDFDNAVIKVLDYFMDQGFTKIGMIAGEERTTDQQELIVDQRFRTFKNYAYENNLYNPNYIFVGDFSAQAGYELMKKPLPNLVTTSLKLSFLPMTPLQSVRFALSKKLVSLCQIALASSLLTIPH